MKPTIPIFFDSTFTESKDELPPLEEYFNSKMTEFQFVEYSSSLEELEQNNISSLNCTKKICLFAIFAPSIRFLGEFSISFRDYLLGEFQNIIFIIIRQGNCFTTFSRSDTFKSGYYNERNEFVPFMAQQCCNYQDQRIIENKRSHAHLQQLQDALKETLNDELNQNSDETNSIFPRIRNKMKSKVYIPQITFQKVMGLKNRISDAVKESEKGNEISEDDTSIEYNDSDHIHSTQSSKTVTPKNTTASEWPKSIFHPDEFYISRPKCLKSGSPTAFEVGFNLWNRGNDCVLPVREENKNLIIRPDRSSTEEPRYENSDETTLESTEAEGTEEKEEEFTSISDDSESESEKNSGNNLDDKDEKKENPETKDEGVECSHQDDPATMNQESEDLNSSEYSRIQDTKKTREGECLECIFKDTTLLDPW